MLLQWGTIGKVFVYELGASQVVLVVKNPPAKAGDIKESKVWLLRRKTLEEVMAAHTYILENPMDREADWPQSMGRKGSDTTEKQLECMYMR